MQDIIKNIKWHNWYLVIAIGIALINRVLLPWNNVFSNGIIKFNTPDAYYFINLASERVQGLNLWPDLLRASHLPIEIAGAFLPVVLFLFSLFNIYYIIDLLFKNNTVTGLATSLVAVMPGELQHRTALGAADHHALEIYLFTMCILCFLMIAKETSEMKIFAGICLIGYTFLYFITWGGALILPFIILATLLIYVSGKIFNNWKQQAILLMASGIMIIAFIWAFYPVMIENVALLLSWQSTTVTEEMPLIINFGVVDMTLMLQNYAVLFLIGLTGIGILTYDYYRTKDIGRLLLLVWTVSMVILTLAQRRWTYYSEINIAILTIYAGYFFVKHFNVRIITGVLMLLIIFVPCIEQGIMMGISKHGYISDDMYAACQWLKDNNNGMVIMSQWDNGHWINYYGQTKAYSSGSGRQTDINRINTDKVFSAVNDNEAMELFNNTGCSYILIDEYTVNGLDNSSGFINRLWYCETKAMELAYSNSSIMIYRRK